METASRTKTPAAELRHVTLRYDSGAQALNDLSLTVRQGEHLCILGANGSGKSTVASVLCGLLAPDEGSVTLLEEPVFDSDRTQTVDFEAYRRARRQIGLVFQNPDDQIVTTIVEEDVAFGPENLGVPPQEIETRVRRELDRVAMASYAKADPTRLSGGQKQRIAIAGALAMEPRVIVFDEPGSLLDVRGRSAIMRVMGRLRESGTTVVHITHFMDEALQADRVVVLERGNVTLEGTPAEVFSHVDRLRDLGLEEPFVARLSRRLQLPWTCDEDELAREIARRSTAMPMPATLPAMPGAPAERTGPANSPAHFPQDGTAAMRADRVSYSYLSERKALDDVSFDIAAGSTVAIVGQTGSGKSTLLRLLCALDVPDTGEVWVNDVCTRRKRDRRRLHGTIGYVMQHPERQLFANTVFEDVAFGPTNLGLSREEVRRRCQGALRLVGLVGYDDASPFELSGGQQRLCAIAGILAMHPRIIVMDEPRAGLDPRGCRELMDVFNRIHSHGVTIVQVTHAMEDAVHADKVVVLDRSHVMLVGTPAEVFSPEHAGELIASGLGLPLPLAWALRLEQEGIPFLGNPLTTNALAKALQSLWEKGGERPWQ